MSAFVIVRMYVQFLIDFLYAFVYFFRILLLEVNVKIKLITVLIKFEVIKSAISIKYIEFDFINVKKSAFSELNLLNIEIKFLIKITLLKYEKAVIVI